MFFDLPIRSKKGKFLEWKGNIQKGVKISFGGKQRNPH